MGIKYFSRLLKQCRQAILHYPISAFKGQKIAIDLLGMGYSYWSIAHREIVNNLDILTEEPDEDITRELFYQLIKEFLNKLLSNEITPIFVIDGDGKHSDEKAKHTKAKRKEDKQKRIDKVQMLKEKLKDPIMVTEKDLKALKQAYLNNSIFSRESVGYLIQLLKTLGFPILRASGLTGEADKLCAYLCQKGYVSAVFSSDRDVLIFGAKYIITKFVGTKFNKYTQSKEPHVELISLKAILEETGLTYRQLVDVAILAGCDYNEKLPRYGIVRIKNLIKKFGCIEGIMAKGFNVNMTNYKVCRKYFLKDEGYEGLCQNPDYTLNIDYRVIEDYLKLEAGLKDFSLDHWIERLILYYQVMRSYKLVPIKIKNNIKYIRIRIRKNNNLTTLEEWCCS